MNDWCKRLRGIVMEGGAVTANEMCLVTRVEDAKANQRLSVLRLELAKHLV